MTRPRTSDRTVQFPTREAFLANVSERYAKAKRGELVTIRPALVKYDAARAALAEARRVDEVKEIRDKALAMAAYARQAQDHQLIRWATEIKIRAERRAGEMLRELAEVGQRKAVGRPGKTSHGVTISPPTLHGLGVTRQQSSDWQQLAAIPAPEFERRLATAAQEPETMTTARILRPPLVPDGRMDPLASDHAWDHTTEWLRSASRLPAVDALPPIRGRGLREAIVQYLATARRYVDALAARDGGGER